MCGSPHLKKPPGAADQWHTMSAETTSLIRELDCRVSDGIEVRNGEDPLEVFHPPYAYAASRPKLAIAS